MNQDDTLDVLEHIQHMGTYYYCSEYCIVAENYAKYNLEIKHSAKIIHSLASNINSMNFMLTNEDEIVNKDFIDLCNYLGKTTFLETDWFKRCWTLQEFLLPKKL